MSLGQYIGLHLYITKGGQSLSLVCHDCSECSSVSYPRFLMTSGRVWNYNFCYLHLFLQSIQNFSTWIAQYITKFSMCQILIIKKFSLAESHPAILHAPFPAAPPHDITFSFKNKDTPLFYSLWSIPSVDDHCHRLGWSMTKIPLHIFNFAHRKQFYTCWAQIQYQDHFYHCQCSRFADPTMLFIYP